MTLGRKGRPPRVESVGGGKFVVAVKGFQLHFLRTVAGGYRLLTRITDGSDRPQPTDEDIKYARAVLLFRERGNVRGS